MFFHGDSSTVGLLQAEDDVVLVGGGRGGARRRLDCRGGPAAGATAPGGGGPPHAFVGVGRATRLPPARDGAEGCARPGRDGRDCTWRRRQREATRASKP